MNFVNPTNDENEEVNTNLNSEESEHETLQQQIPKIKLKALDEQLMEVEDEGSNRKSNKKRKPSPPQMNQANVIQNQILQQI